MRFFFLIFFTLGVHAQSPLFPGFNIPVKYPAITPDGSYMVFLSDDGTAVIAYESFFRDGQWLAPQKFDYINRLIEKTGHEVGGFSFSHDANKLFFHANMTGNFDVFYAEKIRGHWGEPVNIGAPVNTDADEYSPSMSANMKILFVLRRKPTRRNDQCKELLMFEKDADDKWAGPAYLPAEFNVGCQETPFIAADNINLYFSSIREDVTPAGKKIDADLFNIYHAKRINQYVWVYPTLVHELMTGFNDLSPVMNSSGDYFLYNVKAPRLRNQPQHFVKAELPFGKKPGVTMTLSGVITDYFTNEPLKADVTVYDAITSVEKGRFKSADDGNYSIILTEGSSYKIDFARENYSHTYYFKDVTNLEKSGKDVFNTSLYNEINLELNIYDNELYYAITPKVSVFDSISGRLIIGDLKPAAEGKYTCRLGIGKNYRIRVESDLFDPYDTYFDLRTPVFYSDFEKSIELKSTRKLVVLDLPAGVDLKDASFSARNLNRNELITELVTDSEGRYVMSLRIGDTYEIDVTKTGYTFFNTTIDAETSEMETVEVIIEELTTKTRLALNHITFETNSAELNATSYEELGRVVRLMHDNPGIHIEISAHTDDVGADAFNMALSNKRAKSVVDYLVSQGLPTSRLKSRGYGKSQPLVPNTSEENRALNRRVELKVIE